MVNVFNLARKGPDMVNMFNLARKGLEGGDCIALTAKMMWRYHHEGRGEFRLC